MIVVDTNVLVRWFLPSSKTRELLAVVPGLHAPVYARDELLALRPRIIERWGSSWTRELAALEARVTFVPESEYRARIREAKGLASVKDAPFLALALERNCPLWTDDAGLAKQRRVRVFTTRDIVDALA